MANIYSMVVVTQNAATADSQRDLIAETGYWMLAGLKLKDYFKMIVTGMRPASVQTKTNMVYATGTITLSSFANNDTLTVHTVAFTVKTSGATGPLQFNLGADDTAAAANAVLAINAHATTSTMVVATSALGVITLNAYLPGAVGNGIATAISAHGTAGAANLASGTNGDQERTHYYGSSS